MELHRACVRIYIYRYMYMYMYMISISRYQGLCRLRKWWTTSGEELRGWKSERWRRLLLLLLGWWPFLIITLLLMMGGIVLSEQWRTRTLWIFIASVVGGPPPHTFTSNITSLSLASSHHQFCGTPSTYSSNVWYTSWWTDISTIWPASMMPDAGLTCETNKNNL